ncbi:MAG: thrombospondin type 3 repeat-containing protein [Acidobacteriota bacterium]
MPSPTKPSPTMPSHRRRAASTLALVLGLVGLSLIHTTVAFAAAPVPLVLITEQKLGERVLRDLPGASPTARQTTVRIVVDFRAITTSDWTGVVWALVRGADDDQFVIAPSRRFSLPTGDSTQVASLTLTTTDLAPGQYVVQPVALIGRGDAAIQSIEELPALFASGPRDDVTFLAGAERALEVVDQGLEAIEGYHAALASGQPDTVVKGLSGLISHYRLRGQYDKALAAVDEQKTVHASNPAFTALLPIFDFWSTDDLRSAGNFDGAVTRLEQLAATTPPELGLLGQPLAARAQHQLARVHASVENWGRAVDAYDDLIAHHPGVRWSTARTERGNALLRLGKLERAREDYGAVAEHHIHCQDQPADPPATCPGIAQAAEAARMVTILDSSRAWIRASSDELLADLSSAFAARDLSALDALADPTGMRWTLAAGEHREADWGYLARPFFERLLRDADTLSLHAGVDLGTRRVLRLDGVPESMTAGGPDFLFLMLEEGPLGWEWSHLSSQALLSPVGERCEVKSSAGDSGATSKSSHCPEDPPLPPGSVPPAPRRLTMQAPWPNGIHMRAGGLDRDFNVAHFTARELTELFTMPWPEATSRCGAGIPGFMYGFATHTDDSHFAIDYTKGEVAFCIFGACIAPRTAVLHELERAVGLNALKLPVVNPAFDMPALAAHSGIVLGRTSFVFDGNPDLANSVTTGLWNDQPISVAQVITANSATCAGGGCNLMTLADTLEVDFLLRYVHLRKGCFDHCPSIGMWVETGHTLGRMDDTGFSFTSHLHFEVKARPETGVGQLHNWMSVPQRLWDVGLLEADDSGRCIRSHNRRGFADHDGDGIGTGIDNCTTVSNPDQADLDGNGVGDACDPDRDNDGIPNHLDPCPNTIDTEDFDGDGVFDSCDPDVDGDGVPNAQDRCAFFDDARDHDGDGQPDGCDWDSDGDGFANLCESVFRDRCGCLDDLHPLDDTRAGDHDGDGDDSLTDLCPCSHRNEVCRPLDQLPIDEIDLGDVDRGTRTTGRGGRDPEVP